jgi:hypothetical protein
MGWGVDNGFKTENPVFCALHSSPNVLTLIALFSHAEMHYRVASQSRHNAGLLTGKTRRARLSSGFYLNDNE